MPPTDAPSSEPFEPFRDPTPEHAWLQRLAGEWRGETRTWLDPRAEPDVSPTTWRFRSHLGGRFLIQEYQGALGARPFAGTVIHGFDRARGRFTAAWVDSFHTGTAVIVSEGGWEAPGVATSVQGTYLADGQAWGWRTVMRVLDDDRLLVQAFNVPPGGEEEHALETTLTRVRA